jgi:hypothetical protein
MQGPKEARQAEADQSLIASFHSHWTGFTSA